MGSLAIASTTVNPTILRLRRKLNASIKTDSFDAEGRPVMRWGSTYSIKNCGPTLNSISAIKRSRDKLKMLKLLKEYGVVVPQQVDKPPCVARWKTGSRGSGIHFCKDEVDMSDAKRNGAGVFLEWIPIKTEYRFHILRGLLISASEKKKTRGADKNIRSTSHGWVFTDKVKLHMVDAIDLISSAIAAVQAAKLDFGAVDIAMTKDNIPVVFEVNTAPGLNAERAMKYAKAVKKWLDTTQ